MGPHTSSGWIRWAGGCTWAEVVGSAQMIESKVGRRKGNETEEGTEVSAQQNFLGVLRIGFEQFEVFKFFKH